MLAERIDAQLSDRPARDELGRQARETVRREFTWKRCGARTVEAYTDALGR